MKEETSAPRLKNPRGWLAAGEGFRKALRLLPDGSFKLFAHLSLEADRRTGRVQATQKELAAALKKSKRAIVTYATELHHKGVCSIRPGENQYSKTTFEICDDYWPYHRGSCVEKKLGDYVAALRGSFIALGCTIGKFGPGDIRTAEEFERRGIPLETVQDAMLMGACRKYVSWLDGRESGEIGSLRYFEALVVEIQHQPFPPGYREYIEMKVKKFAQIWEQQLRTREQCRAWAPQNHSSARDCVMSNHREAGANPEATSRSQSMGSEVLAQNSNHQNRQKETHDDKETR